MHGAKCFYLFENYCLKNKSCLVEVASDEEIEVFYDNLSSFEDYFKFKPEVLKYPHMDETQRILTLYKLLNKVASPFFILATGDSLAKKTISKNEFRVLNFSLGKTYSREKIIDFFCITGYSRTDFVDDVSQFAFRGEVLDVWSAQSENPYRIVFNEDEVESIKEFDITSQRSKNLIPDYAVLPAKEYIRKGTLKDYMDRHVSLLNADEIPLDDFFSNVNFHGNIKLFIDELEKVQKQNYKIVFFSENTGEQERLFDILEENNQSTGRFRFFIGRLHSGFQSPSRKLIFITYREIFGRFLKYYRLPKFKAGRSLEGLWEISRGDYVVHEKYGIGKFCGLKQLSIGENTSEYIHLEYKGKDKLYVPVTDFHKVQKYIGVEGKKPKLYSLDSALWQRAKFRAKESATELATELYHIYSERKSTAGYSFKDDSKFERMLQESFMYEETPDQINAIEEVKKDMTAPFPMDRLILGDVGFGKTEVAVRAAFKCVINSRQSAVLVPTTVLAEQHYNVFLERLKSFPVNIAMLTRFQSKKEQKKIIDGIRNGLVDIVIGTHRILQDDVGFKNLGLLIIDEEHRFGVRQKEHIKILKKSIDVLSLTATPIPRTLSMSLSGLKDISLIESPPEGRLSIETYILQYNEQTIKNAILHEVARGGQIFYIHNYIRSIQGKKKYLESLMPEIKFAFVHGRMKTQEIEEVMWEFSHGKIDCLVSTTIIEAGLDLPNVNTILIEKAEEFGLSQLYQLRGRIGRSTNKAYCYLFFSAGELTEEAKKRLYALREFTHLGSGFKLALRDMEIRGAGELLGKKQHGFVHDIGLNLYCKFLSEQISKLKGQVPLQEKRVPVLDVRTDAYISSDYIPQEDIRIMFYRKFITAEKEKDITEILEELSDRFGKPPEQVYQLAEVVRVRSFMRVLGIYRVKETEKFIEISFDRDSDPHMFVEYLLKNHSDKVEFTYDGARIKKDRVKTLDEGVVGFLKIFFTEIIEKCLNIC